MSKILGVNIRHYPTQRGSDWDPDPPGVVVILVAGEIGDYAAYCGIGEPQWVADNGDKISFEEACCHFPMGLVREKYRT